LAQVGWCFTGFSSIAQIRLEPKAPEQRCSAMALFSGLDMRQDLSVPNFFQAEGQTLKPLTAPMPVVPCPQDQGIAPQQGDDLTAPNAVTAARLNRVVCVASANVGYSQAAKDTQVLPSALEYEAVVSEGSKVGEFALTLKMIAEFQSAFPAEGMVVWIKKHQQVINDERLSELLLVETAFEDYVAGRWVPITTDIRYTEEAEAVVQAVITSDSGQTAGRVTTEGAVEDAKLGPVGEYGRIVLTYRCENLYSYAEMGMGAMEGARSLVPLGLQLPWAAVDNPGNICRVRATVRGPPGTSQLDPQANILAHRDLQQSLASSGGPAQVMVLPEAGARSGSPEWSFACESLPPKPTCVLAWLSIPNEDAEWEQVGTLQPQTTCASVMRVSPAEEALLGVALPGGQQGHLVRCKVATEAPRRTPGSIRVHTDITVSDASGSTFMKPRGGSECVRSLFNKHEERRMLKRLEAIPKLRDAGILLDGDVWRQHFVIFDHGVRSEFGTEMAVSDLDHATVSSLLIVLATGDATGAAALQSNGKGDLLDSWRQMLSTLRGTTPGGATSFSAGAKKAAESYQAAVKRKYAGRAGVVCTSYVNFDTDGGNNVGQADQAIRELVENADVVQGHVLGVGAWVDQDCASRVAKILKGAASLSLDFPAEAQADALFRQDLSRWVKVLRSAPVTLTVSAGATAWQARHGVRSENGCDCLFAVGQGMRFDAPDVSEMDHTKAVISGLQAGDTVTLYLLSRWKPEELSSRLQVMSQPAPGMAGVLAKVSVGMESLEGVVLGHHWLSMLGSAGSKGTAENKATLCSRLRQRLEDDLSFAWNLPTKSGSTAATGRAKTQQRAPVSKEQQPDEPSAPKLVKASQHADQFQFGGGMGAGLFGGAAPATPGLGGGLFGAAPATPGSGGGFSSGGRRWRERGAEALPTPETMGPPMALAAPGAAPPASAAAMGCFGGPPSGGAFGAAAPLQSPFACMAQQAAPTRGVSFGSAPPGAAPVPFGSFGGHFGAPPTPPAPPGPATPALLLECSGHMRWGQEETPEAAAVRGVRALKHLASMSRQAPAPPVPAAPEDPLVGDLLGAAPGSGALSGRATASFGGAAGAAVHTGFVCDASRANPIVGVRYKATSAFDHDITEACRISGAFAGGYGFRPIPDAEWAMRWALATVLRWWRLLWPDQGGVFNVAWPDLMSLPAAALSQAVMNLPDQPSQ